MEKLTETQCKVHQPQSSQGRCWCSWCGCPRKRAPRCLPIHPRRFDMGLFLLARDPQNLFERSSVLVRTQILCSQSLFCFGWTQELCLLRWVGGLFQGELEQEQRHLGEEGANLDEEAAKLCMKWESRGRGDSQWASRSVRLNLRRMWVLLSMHWTELDWRSNHTFKNWCYLLALCLVNMCCTIP